jgi:tetratricopeptide (TPR) repeat protein
MLLQRFTKLMPLGVMLLVSACGSSGPKPESRPGSSQSAVGAAVVGEDGSILRPEITPQAMTMFEQATAVMASGDYLDAELRFQEFLLQFPAFPGAHVNLAIIHNNNGNDEQAGRAIDAALAIDPNHAPALNQKGMLLRKNGNFIGAEAAYLKAVTANPDYALAHYNLGVLNELYLQRLDVALQHFELYQALVGDDKQVEKWIADLTRRVAASQRTANVAD